jgi:hypothetical protein
VGDPNKGSREVLRLMDIGVGMNSISACIWWPVCWLEEEQLPLLLRFQAGNLTCPLLSSLELSEKPKCGAYMGRKWMHNEFLKRRQREPAQGQPLPTSSYFLAKNDWHWSILRFPKEHLSDEFLDYSTEGISYFCGNLIQLKFPLYGPP